MIACNDYIVARRRNHRKHAMPPLDTPTIRTPTAAMRAGVTTRSIPRWIEDGTMAGAQCPDRRGATDVVWKGEYSSFPNV